MCVLTASWGLVYGLYSRLVGAWSFEASLVGSLEWNYFVLFFQSMWLEYIVFLASLWDVHLEKKIDMALVWVLNHTYFLGCSVRSELGSATCSPN